MRRRTFAGLAAALVATTGVAGPGLTAPVKCDVPEELARTELKLPAVRERLRAGQPVRIVAIGGASTIGAAAGSADLAYPHRLQEALAQSFPATPITVVNKGVPRQSAQQMLERFPSDVIAEDPVMVIWETGINDAVHGTDIDDFASALQRGIDELKTRGIDIMLIDMQFSRRTATVIDFERYLNTLHRIGDVNEVYVFPRYEMMRYWSEENVFNFDDVDKEQRASLAANVYECIGRKLADIIRVAVR